MKRNKKGKMMWINISVEDAWFHFSPIHCEKHRGTQRMVRKRKQFLEASWQDVRGYWQGVAFSDICSAEEISSCLQEITVVGIPTVNVAAHPIQRRHCKLQMSRRIWCAYEEMLRMRAMNTGMHFEFFRKPLFFYPLTHGISPPLKSTSLEPPFHFAEELTKLRKEDGFSKSRMVRFRCGA